MTKYRVFMVCEISHYLDVEADSPEEADDEAMKQGLGQVMFLDHQYPDMGEWEAVETEEIE